MKKKSSLRKVKAKVEFAKDAHTIAKIQEDDESLSPDSLKKFCKYFKKLKFFFLTKNLASNVSKFSTKPKRLETGSSKSAEGISVFNHNIDSSYFLNEG